MRTFRTFEILSLLVATASAAAAAQACGGKAEAEAGSDDTAAGASGGTTSSSGSGARRGGETNDGTVPGSSGVVVSNDCGPLRHQSFAIDPNKCEPQVQTATSYQLGDRCNGAVCMWSVVLPCGDEAWLADAGFGRDGDAGDARAPVPGERDPECEAICKAAAPPNANDTAFFCRRSEDAGVVTVGCGGCGVGRPPTGFVAREVTAPNAEGAWLARIAQLEAASVDAFRALHDDLVRFGAPESLLARIRIAADDEVRHARIVGTQAERFGAVVPSVDVVAPRGRSLEEIAIENAREGCVMETFGAALARIQADRATDDVMRTLMDAIAHDELGHAALSWDLAAWLDDHLDAAARAQVEQARREAITNLDADLAHEAPALPALGLPDATVVRAALKAIRGALAEARRPSDLA